MWMSVVNHLEKSNNLGPIVIIAPCSSLPHPICSLIVNIVMRKTFKEVDNDDSAQ